MSIELFLMKAVSGGYSDFLAAAGKSPSYRLRGEVIHDKNVVCSDEEITTFRREVLSPEMEEMYLKPIATFYSKFIAKQKIVNKGLLKKFKFTGYFLYGNHTHDLGDALIPHFANFPKHNYLIVHANNVSMPFLGKITPHVGALPLPDTKGAYKNFISAIDQRIREKNCIIIYPEAHIWPYYTKIRPFTDVSFTYPIKLDVPTFCFTNTYQKRRFSKKPRVVTYIDGPFYANTDLSPKEQRKHLRDQVYECMCERAKNSNVEYIKYIKKEEDAIND